MTFDEKSTPKEVGVSRRTALTLLGASAAVVSLSASLDLFGDTSAAHASTLWRHPFDKRTQQGDYWHKIRSYGTSPHQGVDYQPRDGNSYQVLAARPGVVTSAGFTSKRGYYVQINHGVVDGATWWTRYLHMVQGSLAVGVGQQVVRGTRLGTMGETGEVTGRHTHIDMARNGAELDSWPYLGDSADLSNDPSTTPTITTTEDDTIFIQALQTGSAGMAIAGYIYSNDIGGHWRGVTNLEGNGYILPLSAAGKLNLVQFNGNDLELVFATAGLWEQIPLDANAPIWSSGLRLAGLGPLTGRLIYPGAAGAIGQWHYPARLGAA